MYHKEVMTTKTSIKLFAIISPNHKQVYVDCTHLSLETFWWIYNVDYRQGVGNRILLPKCLIKAFNTYNINNFVIALIKEFTEYNDKEINEAKNNFLVECGKEIFVINDDKDLEKVTLLTYEKEYEGYLCECGKCVSKTNINRHLKSNIHLSIVKNPKDYIFCECGSIYKKVGKKLFNKDKRRHAKEWPHINYIKKYSKKLDDSDTEEEEEKDKKTISVKVTDKAKDEDKNSDCSEDEQETSTKLLNNNTVSEEEDKPIKVIENNKSTKVKPIIRKISTNNVLESKLKPKIAPINTQKDNTKKVINKVQALHFDKHQLSKKESNNDVDLVSSNEQSEEEEETDNSDIQDDYTEPYSDPDDENRDNWIYTNADNEPTYSDDSHFDSN